MCCHRFCQIMRSINNHLKFIISKEAYFRTAIRTHEASGDKHFDEISAIFYFSSDSISEKIRAASYEIQLNHVRNFRIS